MKKFCLFAFALLVACTQEPLVEPAAPETSSFEANISQPSENATKTVLGAKNGTYYPNYWAAGDAISVNGVTSTALEAGSEYVGTSKAVFTITGDINAPYNFAYPAAFVSNYSSGSARITLPATQNMSSDT